jgi:hypothetical protein
MFLEIISLDNPDKYNIYMYDSLQQVVDDVSYNDLLDLSREDVMVVLRECLEATLICMLPTARRLFE